MKINDHNLKSLIFLLCVLALILPIFYLSAEENLEEICQIENIEKQEKELSKSDYESFLKKCEAYFIEKSQEIEEDINKTEAEKEDLQNTISSLRKKIQNLNYKINESNLIIKDLGLQIEDTQLSIEETTLEIEDLEERLTEILRTIYKGDQKSLIEIFISEEEISDFFEDLVALEILNAENQKVLQDIKDLKSYLENQKISLDDEKEDRENTLAVYTLQKQENDATREEQEYLLKLTEKEYQKYLAEKEEVDKTAAEIRARIFELVGIAEAPTFGEAYEIAKYVESITNVRPAFLLAMLTQESNIGKNVGQCYLKNTENGDGIYIKTGNTAPKTMSPKNIPIFMDITKELGRDPFATPVSCCMYYQGKPYGWGGAMGPAQFIPSTWNLYKDKVKAVTGSPADPWNIRDAFLSAGIYLKELGAAKNEFNAAMHYFSGSTWTSYEEFYGRSVLNMAAGYEKDIAKIESE